MIEKQMKVIYILFKHINHNLMVFLLFNIFRHKKMSIKKQIT